MIHALLLARRSRTPVLALIKLVGICLLLCEMVFIQIDSWHPWPERGTKMRNEARGGVGWPDGSIVGCATVYENYPAGTWHLAIYLGNSWFFRAKGFNFATKDQAINEANKWCKP